MTRPSLIRRSVLASALLTLAGFASAQTIKLTMAHGNPPDNPRHVAALKFADTVKAKTSGRVEIQVAHSAQLGDDAAMVTALRSGSLDFSANSQGAVSSVVPEYAALGTRVNAIVRGKAVPREVTQMPFVSARYFRG